MSGGKRRRGASLIQVTRKSGTLSEDERDLAQRMRARGLGWAAVAGAVGRPIPTLQAALAPRPEPGEADAHG
jgi:hypothetical protein